MGELKVVLFYFQAQYKVDKGTNDSLTYLPKGTIQTFSFYLLGGNHA